jgi:hypothetical protein
MERHVFETIYCSPAVSSRTARVTSPPGLPRVSGISSRLGRPAAVGRTPPRHAFAGSPQGCAGGRRRGSAPLERAVFAAAVTLSVLLTAAGAGLVLWLVDAVPPAALSAALSCRH